MNFRTSILKLLFKKEHNNYTARLNQLDEENNSLRASLISEKNTSKELRRHVDTLKRSCREKQSEISQLCEQTNTLRNSLNSEKNTSEELRRLVAVTGKNLLHQICICRVL